MDVAAVICWSLLGCLCTTLCVPFTCVLARRFGIADQPDNRRKLHGRTVLVCGGIAIAAGLLMVAVFAWVGRNLLDPALFPQSVLFVVGLVVSSLLVLAVGIVDDRSGLSGLKKLAGQMVAAAILLSCGLLVKEISLFGYSFELGLLAAPFTFFWVLACVNAFNLIDGMDGLATTVGVITSGALLAIAFLNGQGFEACVIAAVLGSLLAFLRHNLPPARLFLGDAGSMLVGLLLGVFSLRATQAGSDTLPLLTATALWAIPFLDVLMAIVRRKLTGRSLYATDRAHLHHCLLSRGYSQRRVLLIIGLCTSFTAIGSVVSAVQRSSLPATSMMLSVIVVLIATRHFGYSELRLLVTRARRLAERILVSNRSQESGNFEFRNHLHGVAPWDKLWQHLIQYAADSQINHMQFNVNLPLVHEEFHATWQRNNAIDPCRRWETQLPLIVAGHYVGHLNLAGRCDDDGAVQSEIVQLLAGLKPFDLQLTRMVEELVETAQRPVDSVEIPVTPLRPRERMASRTPAGAVVYRT